jgi:hypothetical protein
MSVNIVNFIGSCDKCLLFKQNQKVESPLLTLFQPMDGPFEKVTMDILGPLPLTHNKNQYVGVVVDHFSRFTTAFPLHNKTAKCFAHKFLSPCCLSLWPTSTLRFRQWPRISR